MKHRKRLFSIGLAAFGLISAAPATATATNQEAANETENETENERGDDTGSARAARDGFILQLALGAGMLNDGVSRETGYGAVSRTGFGLSVNILAGGFVAPGVVIGGGVAGQHVSSYVVTSLPLATAPKSNPSTTTRY